MTRPSTRKIEHHGMRGGERRVTLVIATRDRSDELLRTLGKLRSTHPESTVIVVDNGSRDGTAGRVRESCPEVEVVRLNRNRGAVARNVGVRRATTPYVAFCDDDSWWAEGSLTAAADAFDRHPPLGLVTGPTLVGPEGRPDPLNSRLAVSPLPSRQRMPGPPVLGFLACAAVVRRSAFLAVGGFSPLLFFAGEEALVAYDLTAADWALCYLSGIGVCHWPSTHRPPAPRRQALERRNALLTAWLRRPVSVALAGTRRLAREAVRDPVARSALAGLLARLPAALAARRPLPPSVEREIRLLEAAT